MSELLVNHEKVENNESLNPDELKALQAINNFFDKNVATDQKLREDLDTKNTEENTKIYPDILDAYNTLKDDLTFADAYPTQEYQSQRASIIDYLTDNFWRTNQEVGGKYFSTLHPVVLEAKLYDYNKSFPDRDVIDVAKFMTNFQAEKIQNAMSIQTVVTQKPEIDDYYKDQEHLIGKIFEIPAEEKAHIQDLVKYIHADHSFVLRIFGQADGTPVKRPQSIGNVYNTLRDDLMQGCDKAIQANINKIFPPFDTNNYPDKAAWNVAFAKARALSKISHLPAEDKNKIFAGDYIASWSGEHKLWNTVWNFKTVQETGHQYTQGSVEIEQKLDIVAKRIVEQRENYIQNIGLNAIGFTISDTAPRYKWQEITTQLKTNGLITADFKFTKKSDRKTPQEALWFIDSYGWDQSTEAVYNKSSDRKINIVIPYAAIESGDYDQFISYEKTPDGEVSNIQLKPISFKDALDLFKKINPEESAQKYAANTEASLNNFDKLTAALEDNIDLKIAVAKELIKKPAFTSENYKQSAEYQSLQELGIYTQESTIAEWKNAWKKVVLFYIDDDSGKKISIESKSI